MKFKCELKRTSLKTLTLLPGKMAFTFSEDPDGRSMTEIVTDLTNTESMTDDVMDLMLRKFIIMIEVDNPFTKEDYEDVETALRIIDEKSLIIRSKVEKHKAPAIIALERIIVTGCIRHVECLRDHDLLMLFNYITFDMSKYSAEEMRANTFAVAAAQQQMKGNVTWILSNDYVNHFDDEVQLDRGFIKRLETFAIFTLEGEGVDNPYVNTVS